MEFRRVLFRSEKIRVQLNDILYIEAAGNYMTFVLLEQRILSRLTMQETLDLLPSELFIRIHRSYIVAKDKVEKLERHSVHIGEITLPLSTILVAGYAFYISTTLKTLHSRSRQVE